MISDLHTGQRVTYTYPHARGGEIGTILSLGDFMAQIRWDDGSVTHAHIDYIKPAPLPGACPSHIATRPLATLAQARTWVAEFETLPYPALLADLAGSLSRHPSECCRRARYAQSLILDAIGEWFGAPLPSSLGARHDASYPLSARSCTNPQCWLPTDHKGPCDTGTPCGASAGAHGNGCCPC